MSRLDEIVARNKKALGPRVGGLHGVAQDAVSAGLDSVDRGRNDSRNGAIIFMLLLLGMVVVGLTTR